MREGGGHNLRAGQEVRRVRYRASPKSHPIHVTTRIVFIIVFKVKLLIKRLLKKQDTSHLEEVYRFYYNYVTVDAPPKQNIFNIVVTDVTAV